MNDDMTTDERGADDRERRDEAPQGDDTGQATDTSGRSGGGDHPSQAEGEDPENPPARPDPDTTGHPSQAEG